MGRRQAEMAMAIAGLDARDEVDEALERRPIVRELFERIEDLELQADVGRALVAAHREGAHNTDEIVAFIEGDATKPVVICDRCREPVGHPFRGEQPPAVTAAIEVPAPQRREIDLVEIRRMLDASAESDRKALASSHATFTRMRVFAAFVVAVNIASIIWGLVNR